MLSSLEVLRLSKPVVTDRALALLFLAPESLEFRVPIPVHMYDIIRFQMIMMARRQHASPHRPIAWSMINDGFALLALTFSAMLARAAIGCTMRIGHPVLHFEHLYLFSQSHRLEALASSS